MTYPAGLFLQRTMIRDQFTGGETVKKILLALLLLVLLLAGSAPAYAYKGTPGTDSGPLTCTFDRYVAPYYEVFIAHPSGRLLSRFPINVAQDLIWQEIGGDLVPAYPEIGSVWDCRVDYIEDCDWECWYIVELMVLVKEITP